MKNTTRTKSVPWIMNRLLPLTIIFALAILSVMDAHAEVMLTCQGSARQLCVDGTKMLILGGELGNSSATSAEDIDAIFPKLKRMNLNTVLVPAYWELIEPEKGQFDFSLTDYIIDAARDNGLKIVFLWFGAWKNSMSCYAPSWFKADYMKYPRAVARSGKPLEIASVFSEEVFRADCAAFTEWLHHVTEYDGEHTVIMLQIENEIGMLESARDYSVLAEKEYSKGVPSGLISYIKNNEKVLHPDLLERWKANGKKNRGSWTEVFGDDIYTDEYFMAWNYASYVERLAREARRLTSMPLYVNAAMNSRGRKPGEYPSAGPLAHLKDIWHAAAPTIDFLSPDLYDKGFTDWVDRYATPDNTLFIPEIKLIEGNAVQAFYVIGEKNAIGLSPFSIENGDDSPQSANVRGYALLRRMMPVLLSHQGDGSMRGFYFDSDSTERVLRHKDLKITASHYFTLPWDSRASDGSEWPVTGGVMIELSPREYIIAGTGLVVKFEHESETVAACRLGEDGFADAGGNRTSAGEWTATQRVGLAHVQEVRINPDGSFSTVRHFNGDETHQGRHVRIGVDDFKVIHIQLYDYK